MTALTSAEIEAILKRAEAASPGKWEIEDVAAEFSDSANISHARETADATFIVHARTDVPRLCRELLEARKALSLIEEKVGEVGYDDGGASLTVVGKVVACFSQLAAELRVALKLIEIMGEQPCPVCLGTANNGSPCWPCDSTGKLLVPARRKMEMEK